MTDGIIFKNNFILDLYNFMFPFQPPNETTLYFGPNLTRCVRNQNKFINLSYVKYRCKNLVTEVISTKKKGDISSLFESEGSVFKYTTELERKFD